MVPSRRQFSPLLVYCALLAVGIPWYWPAGNVWQWGPFPAWVTTSVLAGIAGCVFTAWRLRQPWQQETQDQAREPEETR